MLSVLAAISPAVAFVPGLPGWTDITAPFGMLAALGLGGVSLLRIKVSDGGLAWSGIVLGTLELLLLSGVMYLFYGNGLCQ